MKKNLITTIILFFLMNTVNYAIAAPGDYASLIKPDIAFASIEGSYNWIDTYPLAFNGHVSMENKQNWGGRGSGGLLYFPVERFGMGAEVGWGYYGTVKTTSPLDRWSARAKLDGFDFLFDLLYKFEYLDVLGGMGFLVQNQHLHLHDREMLGPVREILVPKLISLYDQTGIFPEIKVGVLYHLNDYWGITLSYEHVFGSATQNAEETDSSGEAIIGTGADQGNPTLDTLMLGIRFNFEP